MALAEGNVSVEAGVDGGSGLHRGWAEGWRVIRGLLMGDSSSVIRSMEQSEDVIM